MHVLFAKTLFTFFLDKKKYKKNQGCLKGAKIVLNQDLQDERITGLG